MPLDSSSARAQAQPVIEYPVTIDIPIIERWRGSNTGVPFVHRRDSGVPGPELLVTALVHGNEPAGAVALDQLLHLGLHPTRGALTLVFANVDAYARFDLAKPRASRWAEEDLNRVWSDDILASQPPRSIDVARAAALRPFVEAADYLLDLHTTQHPNEPLVLAGPLERSRRLARSVGLTELVVIDRGHAQGGRMRDYGSFGEADSHKTALLIECGQHWAAAGAAVAYAACLRMLTRLRMLPEGFDVGPTTPLPDQGSRFVEITMPVTIRREFVFALPLRGGEIIPKAGTIIGYDGGEPIVTPYDDCVAIMPSQRLWAGLTAVRLGRMIAPSEEMPLNMEPSND